jgi:peptide/nickel transport system substrate-binding protein
VGVEVVLNSIPDSQFVEYKNANELEASIYTGEGGAGLNAILDPRYFVPASYFSIFGIGWYNYWTQDPTLEGVEPPQWVEDYRTKFQTEVQQAASEEAQVEAMKEILEMAADEFWVIGISWPCLGYQPWSDRVHNLPEQWTGGWIPGVLKIMYPEQWYLTDIE